MRSNKKQYLQKRWLRLAKKYQNTPLTKAKNMLKESHQDVIKVIETFYNDELFAKEALVWTGTFPLGAYCVSATASHYDWAI